MTNPLFDQFMEQLEVGDVLRAAIKRIKAEPTRLNMLSWTSNLYNLESYTATADEFIAACGTTACAAGWIVMEALVDQDFPIFFKTDKVVFIEDDDVTPFQISIADLAVEIVRKYAPQVPAQEIHAFFSMNSWLHSERTQYDNGTRQQRADLVIKMLTEIVQDYAPDSEEEIQRWRAYDPVNSDGI